MKLDAFFQLFVVKEKKFYPLYISQAENIVKAATLLIRLTKEEDTDNRRILAKRIKECETAGDAITNSIFHELLNTFVTPFDREDIHQLASQMDTFLDFLNDSAKKFSIYQPKGVDQKLIDIAEYILKDAECLLEMTKDFENIRKDVVPIGNHCSRMKEIEHIVDDIYEAYMSFIFQEEKDPIELVKKKNIVQALEDTTDHAKDVAETVRGIIFKMS